MSLNKWVVRKADGQFCLGSGPAPSVYLTDQVNYVLVDLGDKLPTPDPRTQKWDGKVVSRTPAEIAAFDSMVCAARAGADCQTPIIQALIAVLAPLLKKTPDGLTKDIITSYVGATISPVSTAKK